MAAGDKKNGNLRYVRKLVNGHQLVIFGPVDSDEIDQTTIENALYIGVGARGASNVYPPLGKEAICNPGEALTIQLNPDNAVQIDTDHASHYYAITVSEKDMNTGEVRPRVLRLGDRTLVAGSAAFGIADDPTPTANKWNDVLAFVVPDRKQWLPRGRQRVKFVTIV